MTPEQKQEFAKEGYIIKGLITQQDLAAIEQTFEEIGQAQVPGGLLVVPKTNSYDIVCPDLADVNESFTTHYVKPPQGTKAVPVIMDKGDILFFNGNLIHGCYHNKTKDQFRRAFICHCANASTTKISGGYRPLYHADGSEIDLVSNPDGGPCGIEFDTAYAH